ncbi:MAG: heme oxygenase [Icmadophila ericetorum]|nr:heme oxygenase [Icmadophila ericetorum]
MKIRKLTQSDPLLTAIAAKTRQVHADLNHLILSRLPLALAPHSTNADFYAIGLQHIAQICFTFEETWLTHLENASSSSPLYPPNNLQPRPTPHLPPNLRPLPHIRNTTTSKPHLLLAYTWIFYMALFNGGRYIHTQLHADKEYFWSSCLRLWHFSDGEAFGDGKPLKQTLRTTFQEIESFLTPLEKEEIVSETLFIFHQLALVVQDLDAAAATHRVEEGRRRRRSQDETAFNLKLAKHLLPMGMADLVRAWVRRGAWAASEQQLAEPHRSGTPADGRGIGAGEGVGELQGEDKATSRKTFFEARPRAQAHGSIGCPSLSPNRNATGNSSVDAVDELPISEGEGSVKSRTSIEVGQPWKDQRRRPSVSSRI